MQRIEVLFFDGCPSWQNAWAVLGTFLAESGWEVSVRLRDVTMMAPEELVGFAGSPTIRVDGVDLFGYVGPAVMACRRYEDNGGQGWPSVASLRARLGAALDGATPSP
jgi:hypothetical protein